MNRSLVQCTTLNSTCLHKAYNCKNAKIFHNFSVNFLLHKNLFSVVFVCADLLLNIILFRVLAVIKLSKVDNEVNEEVTFFV